MNRRIKIKESTLRGMIKKSLNEVMDELNLYHGTNADFDHFDIAYLSTGWGQQAYGYGFYLTTSYDAAKDYAYDANHGQVMEVEVPDGKYLTDVSISKAEANRIARIFFKYMTEENEDTRNSYSTEDEKRCFWDYEVDYVRRCSTGSYIYGTIASLMGSDKDTSEFLHDKCGYVGLKIRDRYNAGKKKPITYVIFNQNDIKIINKNVIKEKIDKSKVGEFHKIFTFGKYNGQDKVKVILEDPEYCVWLYNKMRYCPFTDNQLGLLDVSYYKKYRVFPIKSPKTPNYAQIKGVLVKNMTAEQLSYVYENGTDEFKWLVKQEHTNRGWHYHPYKRYPVFQTDDLYENIDKR